MARWTVQREALPGARRWHCRFQCREVRRSCTGSRDQEKTLPYSQPPTCLIPSSHPGHLFGPHPITLHHQGLLPDTSCKNVLKTCCLKQMLLCCPTPQEGGVTAPVKQDLGPPALLPQLSPTPDGCPSWRRQGLHQHHGKSPMGVAQQLLMATVLLLAGCAEKDVTAQT